MDGWNIEEFSRILRYLGGWFQKTLLAEFLSLRGRRFLKDAERGEFI